MRNFQRTLLIGATGKLGTHRQKLTTRELHIHDLRIPIFWNSLHDIDTVWLVAPTLPRLHQRRDRETKRTEIQGVRNIVDAFRDKHILYTSTKVVYGLTDDDVDPLSVHHIGNLFMHAHQGIQNVPYKEVDTLGFSHLGEEHRIYAETKLACEAIVATAAKHLNPQNMGYKMNIYEKRDPPQQHQTHVV